MGVEVSRPAALHPKSCKRVNLSGLGGEMVTAYWSDVAGQRGPMLPQSSLWITIRYVLRALVGEELP